MPYTKPFNKLLREFKKEYLGEKVPLEYQDKYGTMYNKKDILSFAMATAKKKRIPIEIKPVKKKGLYFQ